MNIMNKAVIVLSVALCGFFSSIGLAFANPSDIQGHWAEKQIVDWVERGFVKGYPNGAFNPDDSITRAEFITLVNNSFGFYKKAQVTFSDVSPTDWFYGEVARAGAAGYIKGYGDGTLRPDNAVSRQELAVVIFHLLDITATSDNNALSTFKDTKKISSWAKPGVSTVAGKNLMRGYPGHTFRPLASTTRAEALVGLDRAFWFKHPVIITG